MKTTTFILATGMLLASPIVFGQGNGNGNGGNGNNIAKWEVEGNVVNPGEFIGSVNNEALIFKTNGEEWMRLNTQGHLGLGITNPTVSLDVLGKFRLNNGTQAAGRFLTTDDLGYTQWADLPDMNHWSLNGSSVYYDQGGVGIGLTSPQEKLDVNGNGLFHGSVQLQGSGNGITFPDGTTQTTAAVTNGATSMEVTEYLKVGSNTLFLTAPAANIPGVPTSSEHEIFVDNDDLFLMSNGASGSYNTIMNANTNGGNVGIGLSNPTAKLDLRMNNNYPYTNESGVRITYPIAALIQGVPPINTSVFEIRQQGIFPGTYSRKFVVRSGGNTSIGTGDPGSTRLHVENAGASPNTKILHLEGALDQNIFFVPRLGSSGYNWHSAPGDMGLFFSDNHTDNANAGFVIAPRKGSWGGMRMDKDGNLALGRREANARLQVWGNAIIGEKSITTGPHTDFQLAVDGKLVAKEVVVTLDNWADYVFEDNYQLMPVEEVEAFINENGHLPQIPSACEVEENGVEVSEMLKLQMQKIEELTLYMIELKKENEQQQKLIEQLTNNK